MKLLKKFFAWLVLCLCVVIPNILITLIGCILPTTYFFNMAILIIYLILIVASFAMLLDVRKRRFVKNKGEETEKPKRKGENFRCLNKK